MSRLMRLISVAGLGFALFIAPLAAQPSWASHTNDEEEGPPLQEGEQWRDAQVDGVVYHIRQIEGKTVLTVLDTEVRDSIDVYLVNPGLNVLVQNGTACVGRYVVAAGVRTSPYTLDAQGLTVDLTRTCGPPPK